MDSTIETKVQWLMDRTAISELLFSFAQALDTKDFSAYRNNYAEGGCIELPDPESPGRTFTLRKERMLELVQKTLGRYTTTHHISANHQITIEGDTARSRSYLQAVHVTGQALTDHWSCGGWYDSDYIRTTDGWKFTRVRLVPAWLAGNIQQMNPDH